MLLDELEPAFRFNSDDDSLGSYQEKMNHIIEVRVGELKNLNNNQNDISNSCYELFNAYMFLIEAFEENGKVSNAIKYAQNGIEYCEIYRKWVMDKDLYKYTQFFEKILGKYKG